MSFRTIEEIRSGKSERKDPPKWIQGILVRAWFLLIPFLAFDYVKSKRIEPALKQREQEIAQEVAKSEAERVQVLSEVTQINIKKAQLGALADTFQVRFADIQAVLDSIAIIQRADMAERTVLEAERDSLLRVVSLSMGEQQQKSKRLEELQSKLNTLRETIDQRETESARLEKEAAANRDLAKRVLDPEQFETITALVNGSGRYPDRDANNRQKRKESQK